MNYYDSRYYSSSIRRFIQPDTWLPDVYDPQQLNRYSYANNNPLRYTDPSGHNPVLALAFTNPVTASIAGAAIGFSFVYSTNPTVRDVTNAFVANAIKNISTWFSKPAAAISTTQQQKNQQHSKTSSGKTGGGNLGGSQGGGSPQTPNPIKQLAPLIPPAAYDTLQKIQENGGRALEGFHSGIYQNVTKPFLPKVGELGRYMEHDIKPLVEGVNRGTQRLVIDTLTGKSWYTPDHYESWIPFK